MAKEVKNIRKFLEIVKRPGVSRVVIVKKKGKRKKSTNITKIKVRTKKYLYTMIFTDRKKAEKVENIIPQHIPKECLPKKGTGKASKK